MLRLVSFSLDCYWAYSKEGNDSTVCRDVAAGVAGWPRFFSLGRPRIIGKATANTFAPKVNLLVPEFCGLCPVPTTLPRGANHDFQRLYVAGVFPRKCSSSNHLIHLPASIPEQTATHIHATRRLYRSVCIVSVHHGGHFALHVCRGDQGSEGLGWILAHGD